MVMEVAQVQTCQCERRVTAELCDVARDRITFESYFSTCVATPDFP